MSTFISARLRDLEIDAFFSAENNHHIYEELHTMLKLLAKVCDFSLRGMEQLLMRVVLVLCTLEKKADGGYSINLTLLTFLIMARLRMREHYDKYIRGADWQGMVNHWESDLMAARIRWRNEDERAQLHAIAALTTAQVIMTWYSPLEHSDALNVISHYEKKAENASNDAREYYKEVARYVRHFIQNNSRGINLGFFVRKIEMLDQFRFSDDAAEGNGN